MTNEEANDPRRKALEEKYKSVKKKAEDCLKWNTDLSKDMSEILDASVLGIKAAKYGSPYGDWETAITSVERLDCDLDKIGLIINTYHTIQPALSSDSVSVIYSGSALVTGSSSMYISEDDREQALLVNAEYGLFFEKYKLKDEILVSMVRFGFNMSTRGKKAIEKFTRGWELFYRELPNIDTSIGAIIPLRASIDLSIDELLSLRKSQPRGYKPKRKIIEIGMQLKADAVSMVVFEEMEQEYPKLVDRLSGTKTELYNREMRYDLLRDGTLFLNRLFSSLDLTKLRNRHNKRKPNPNLA